MVCWDLEGWIYLAAAEAPPATPPTMQIFLHFAEVLEGVGGESGEMGYDMARRREVLCNIRGERK